MNAQQSAALAEARPVLQAYGYGLNAVGNILLPDGKAIGAAITYKRKRYRVESATTGRLLFSTGYAAGLSSFLEKYWFAKKVQP